MKDKEKAVELYKTGKYTKTEVSKLIGRTSTTVGRWLPHTGQVQEMHGGKGTRLYGIYQGAKRRSRCKPSDKNYKYYKHVTMCDDWLDSFTTFRDWALRNGYADDLMIDRIDNSKGYCPENCRWVDSQVNTENRTFSKFDRDSVKIARELYFKGVTGKKLAEVFKTSKGNISEILNNKTWVDEDYGDKLAEFKLLKKKPKKMTDEEVEELKEKISKVN